MVFEISPGEYLRVSVNWTNTGQERHAFSILAAYGMEDPETHEWIPKDAVLVENEVLEPGETKTTNCDFREPIHEDLAGLTLDVYVAILDYENPEEPPYDECFDPAAIKVTSS